MFLFDLKSSLKAETGTVALSLVLNENTGGTPTVCPIEMNGKSYKLLTFLPLREHAQ